MTEPAQGSNAKEEGDKKPEKVPWYLYDRERIDARLESFYQVGRALGGDEDLPDYDQSDVKQFIKSQPVQGARFQTLETIGKLCGFAGGVGAISCGAISYRYGKTGIYALLGGVLGACAASMVTDDICSWAYGTWKYDNLATREAFADWIIQRKLDEAEGNLPEQVMQRRLEEIRSNPSGRYTS